MRQMVAGKQCPARRPRPTRRVGLPRRPLISRVEIGGADGEPALPCLNMPFKCGLCFGAIHFAEPGRARDGDLLILAGEPYRNQRTLSDLAGQDAKHHKGRVEDLVRAMRSFLAAKARAVMPPDTSVRGHGEIVQRLARFRQQLESRPSSSPPRPRRD